MNRFHVITGLPRSGSTLLCNLLNQRKDTYASSTSALPNAIAGISQIFTNSPEETSRLANIPGTKNHHADVIGSICRIWHDTELDIVFDKSRGWVNNILTLRVAIPDAAVIVTVRDPREIIASIERHHRQTAQYGPHGSLLDRASQQMSPEGLVGAPIQGIEDLLRRNLPGVLFVTHKQLSTNPVETMQQIEKVAQLEEFKYDFNNVEPTSTDLDVLYRDKYPHEGFGKVRPYTSDWSDVLDDDLAEKIAGRWPFFMKSFGYI